MCVFRTRHISRVLKFFLHFSQTANLESGNLTFSDCVNPGGVNVKIFWNWGKRERRRGRMNERLLFLNKLKRRPIATCDSPHAMLPAGTSFAVVHCEGA